MMATTAQRLTSLETRMTAVEVEVKKLKQPVTPPPPPPPADTTADAGGDLKVTATAPATGKTISYTVAGLDSDATALVTFKDVNAKIVTKTVLTNGTYSADLSTLADGTVTVTIKATDKAVPVNTMTKTGASMILRGVIAGGGGLLPGQFTSPVTSTASIITPLALPSVPSAGGTVTDTTFPNIKFLFVAGAAEGDIEGISYSNLSSLNADNTLMLVVDGTAGGTQSTHFYEINPTTKARGTKRTIPATPLIRPELGVWSRANANYLYAIGRTDAKIYRVDFTTRTAITISEVNDYAGVGSILSSDRFWQPFMSDDDDYMSVTWRNSSDANKGYAVLRLSTGAVICAHTVASGNIDECLISRDATKVYVKYSSPIGGFVESGIKGFIHNIAAHTNVDLVLGTPTYAPGHCDTYGTDGVMGINGVFVNQWFKRSMATPTSPTVIRDNESDWDLASAHASMRADDQTWALISYYEGSLGAAVMQDEITLAKMDGTGAVRRLFNHHSATDGSSYWEIPKANISRDGKFVAFTSNWGMLGGQRYALLAYRADGASFI